MQADAMLSTQTSASPRIRARSETLTAAVFAALLGLFVIWGVGFSHVSVFHNAAHDVRHSNGFPCH
jgi:cobalt transporter subunit CbtB